MRLRLSSLEPSELSPALVETLAKYANQVCDHFHLPLQSGHDRILGAMRRTYTSAEYSQSVRSLRQVFPGASIGADVIPGFPGESEDEFLATLDLVQELELSYLHVFPYSQRPNTAAARMPNHLPPEVIKARADQLRQLSKTLQKKYYERFVGQKLEVLWEGDCDSDGRRLGHTRNYLNVASSARLAESLKAGDLTPMTIKGFVTSERLLASD